MSALRCHTSAFAGARQTGRVQRARLQVQAVAVPRNKVAAPSAAPQARSVGHAGRETQAVAVAAPTITAQVHVLAHDSYRHFLAEHADKLVILDFFTTWCGPCKMIAPELERMAQEMDPSKVVFAKLDCGATNESKKLAMALGIKALPTFHLYRGGSMADMMTGAKIKSLQELISKHA